MSRSRRRAHRPTVIAHPCRGAARVVATCRGPLRVLAATAGRAKPALRRQVLAALAMDSVPLAADASTMRLHAAPSTITLVSSSIAKAVGVV